MCTENGSAQNNLPNVPLKRKRSSEIVRRNVRHFKVIYLIVHIIKKFCIWKNIVLSLVSV